MKSVKYLPLINVFRIFIKEDSLIFRRDKSDAERTKWNRLTGKLKGYKENVRRTAHY